MPQWCIDQPPLGIAYLTGYLLDKGYSVEQRDYSIELYAGIKPQRKYLLDDHRHPMWVEEETYHNQIFPVIAPFLEKWTRQICNSDAPFIGFTVLCTNRLCTLDVVREVKRRCPEKTIIVGGPHVTRYEGGFQMAEVGDIDFVVPDEGEETLHELLECLIDGRDPDSIKGLIFRRDGKTIDTGQRPLIQKISELPLPRFDQFDLKSYRMLTIPILGSRGCIYSCAFCSETVFWRRYRFRTGQNLFEEFKLQTKTLGITNFFIVDSLINGNVKELEKFCDLIIENQMKVTWGGKASIRMQMTSQILNKMAKAGCQYVTYGLESGSPKVVKDMQKGFDHALASRVIRETHDAGIKCGVFMMVGFPTESEEDYQLSKNFLKEHRQYPEHVTPGVGCGIQPGSDLHENPQKYGIRWENGKWYSEFTTPEIRQFRVTDFREFCTKLEGVNVTY